MRIHFFPRSKEKSLLVISSMVPSVTIFSAGRGQTLLFPLCPLLTNNYRSTITCSTLFRLFHTLRTLTKHIQSNRRLKCCISACRTCILHLFNCAFHKHLQGKTPIIRKLGFHSCNEIWGMQEFPVKMEIFKHFPV